MKFLKWMNVIAIAFLATTANPAFTRAQAPLRQPPKARYLVKDLGTLGGSAAEPGGISNTDWVEGWSLLSGDAISHVFLWHNGVMRDLGTLGGPNSSTEFRPSDAGDVGGFSEISKTDPNGEDFCEFGDGSNLACLAFFWHNGRMVAQPTLGGPNSSGFGVNDLGELAGTAENKIMEPTCASAGTGNVLQYKPVIWKDGRIYQLPTLPGDPVGVVYAINNYGQAVGNSGQCGAGNVGDVQEHAVLWQNGKAIDLGSLGSTINNNPEDINCRGDVVGFANTADDETFHAYVWRKGVMTDLGTLPGDIHSVGQAINCQGQVVGRTSDADFNGVGFLWENGVMSDLNTLIPADSPLYISDANGINDLGQIVAIGVTTTGDEHAVLLTPIGDDPFGARPTALESVPRRAITHPEYFRKLQRPHGSLSAPR
jgi:probable HAF family extracellular repeat protein